MRTVKQLPAGIPRETDYNKFPDSTVINETETEPGTPVVREIYGDVLTNLYKLIRLGGLVPNNLEDNELNGYQLISALKKFSNDQNDIEQILSLTGTVFSLPLNFTILPDKYVCVVRAAAPYVSSVNYTIKGNGAGNEEYGLTSASGFGTGDVVLMIIDHSGARAYNLSDTAASVPAEVFTPFGIPLAFNSGNKMYYEAEGKLYSDLPEVYDLQQSIRVAASDGTLIVYEVVLTNGYVICLTFKPSTSSYSLYRFAVGALSTPLLLYAGFASGTDRKPNIYTDGTTLAVTNGGNSSANDYAISFYTLDMVGGTVSPSGTISLDNAFSKTTNAVMRSGMLYTLIAGQLVKYNLGSGVRTVIGSYPGFIGTLFAFNGEAYYSNGEVAKKWTLQ